MCRWKAWLILNKAAHFCYGKLIAIAGDIHNTFRSWRRNPGSVFAAWATLTIGIAATTTIFSVLSSMLLRPLPVPDAEHVVRISGIDRVGDAMQMSMPDALDLKKQLHSAAGFAFFRSSIRNLAKHDKPVMVHVLEADADLFTVMGAHPFQGRAFVRDSNEPGHDCEAVLAWPFWRRHFGGGDVAGTGIRLNQAPCMLDGVLPQGIDLPAPAEMWVPAQFDLNAGQNARRIRAWYALATMKPNVTLKAFNSELASIAEELSRQHPAEDTGLGFRAVLLQDWLAKDLKTSVLILFAAVLGVLLMVCANVANLLLARASTRVPEMSVRVAVGASRARLFQQMLTESLLLALAAAASGLVVTMFAVRLIRDMPNTKIPRPESIVVDWRVMLFAIVAAAITGILFGTLPALRVSMVSLTEVLKQASGRVTDSHPQQGIRKLLLAADTAIATVLLIASLLLVRSFQEASKTNPGFEADHLLTAYVSLPPDRYGKDTLDLARFARNVIERLKSRPGIIDATVTTSVPLQSTHGGATVQIEGQPLPAHESDAPLVLDTEVNPGFCRTVGIPLLAGRDLEERDDRESGTAILVNAAFARRFFGNQSAVGRRLRYNPTVDENAPWQQIVGVVADTQQDGLERAVKPEVFIPLARAAGMFPAVIIRTADDPGSHLRDIENAVHQVDVEVPVFSVRTMEQVAALSLGVRTFNTALLSGFALIAVLLAALGISAVIAYSVSQRTAEVGIRMACGASQGDIVSMIIREGVVPAASGIVAGVLLASVVNRFLASLLYAVQLSDFTSYAGAVILLATVSVIASLVPALRAARIDPWRALRYE